VRHTPQARTRISTSPLAGFGTGTLVNWSGFVSIRAGALSKQAFMAQPRVVSANAANSSLVLSAPAAKCCTLERKTTQIESRRKNELTVFTGIIEHEGTIEALEFKASGGLVTIYAPSLASKLAVSNSIAVNGCCLTIVALGKKDLSADLSNETIQKTSFGTANGGLTKGSRVNLEQPLTAGKEFGGHFVLGHIDGTGRVTRLNPEGSESGSWWFGLEVSEDFARYIVPKGSITIDGISLTVARWNKHTRIAEVAVIPYTYEHTNIRDRKPGDAVNLEGDVLGKYVERYLEARNLAPSSAITMSRLLEEGF
jgi:riboflavin synthase